MFKIDSISNFNILYTSFIILIIILFVSVTIYIDHNFLVKIKNVEKIESKYLAKQRSILSNKVDRIIEYINFTKADIDSSLRIDLKDRVYEAHSISMNLYEKYKNKLNDKELKELITESLRPIRYNSGKGYYFIVSMDGIEKLYPVKPEFEGQNVLDLKDVKGKFVIKEEINTINKNEEGFVDGYWYKPNDDRDSAFLKLTFVKLFKPFNWYIGSGGYLDNVTGDLKKKVLNRIRKIDAKENIKSNDDKNLTNSNKSFVASKIYDDENLDLVDNIAYNGNLFVYELMKVGGGDKFAKQIFILQKFRDKEGAITKFLKSNYISTNFKDIKGDFFIKSLFDEMKTSGQAFGFYYDKNNKTKEEVKINIYVKYFPEWNWMIATSHSFDDIDVMIESIKNRELLNENKEKYKLFTFSFIIIIIVLIFSTYLSRTMNNDFKRFYKFFHRASTFEGSIDPEKLIFSEFKELSDEVNKMIILFKESTKSLGSNENQFRTFINQANEYMIIKDIQGRYVKVNKKFCDLLKMKEEDIVGKRPEDIGYNFEATEDMDEIDIEILRDKKTIVREKEAILARNIGTKWLEESVFPIFGDLGKIAYIGIVSRDITRRKLAEQDLLNKNKELENAYENLQKGKEIIIKKEKLASLGTFTAGIAHEINNPTQAIKFSMNSLNLNLTDIKVILKDITSIDKNLDDNEKILKLNNVIEKIDDLELKEIISEIDEGIIENLQSLTRIKNIINSTKRMAHDENEFKKASINEVIKDSLNLVNNEIKYSVKIKTNLVEGIPKTTCLTQEIGQVFINCLLNAKDSIIEKGLSINKSEVIISSTYDIEKQEIIVIIRDNGIGIAKEKIKKIFDPFYTTKNVGKGTGLGLNLSHQILVTHNGRIEVESEEGKWAEFRIVLPVV